MPEFMRAPIRLMAVLMGISMGLWSLPVPAAAQVISNTVSGSSAGMTYDTTNATVNLNRTVSAGVADPGTSTVTVNPNVVLADGVAVSTITVTLRDAGGLPLSGKTVTLASDRGVVDTIVQPAVTTDVNGVATGTLSSNTTGLATITATDITDSVVLNDNPQVAFTAGQVLKLKKSVHDREAVIGDSVRYTIEVENTAAFDVGDVRILDQTPPGFKYRKGTALLDGVGISDPGGNRPLNFNLGTIAAGQTVQLTYFLTIGSGARPGEEYENRAVAREGFIEANFAASGLKASAVCNACSLSNPASAVIRLVFDPIFDLGTIIGKVFHDVNRNGYQDQGEEGVSGAMVALDNGTYVITDEGGRYHIPSVKPGQRMLKIHLPSVPGAVLTTDESRVITVTRGLLNKVNFGVSYNQETEAIGEEGVQGLNLNSMLDSPPVQILGNTEDMSVVINGLEKSLPGADIRMGKPGNKSVGVTGSAREGSIAFNLAVDEKEDVKGWKFRIYDKAGEIFHAFEGQGAPPKEVLWDGENGDGIRIKAGEFYRYSLSVLFSDGSLVESSLGNFILNRIEELSFSFSAFEAGNAELNEEGRKILEKAAEFLKLYPDEKITIEGHADSTGSEELNFRLSKERVQRAVEYLVRVHHVSPERFDIKWYGSSRPIADNESEEGRTRNRRIEMQGGLQARDYPLKSDELVFESRVEIDGEEIQVLPDGGFRAEIADLEAENFRMALKNQAGRRVETMVSLPTVTFTDPTGKQEFKLNESGEGYQVYKGAEGGPVMSYTLRGKTSPGNHLSVNGKSTPVGDNGDFQASVEFTVGENSVEVVSITPGGTSRTYHLIVNLSDRDEKGNILMAVRPIPALEVRFPTGNSPLKSGWVPIQGSTDPGNAVTVQGKPVFVNSEGRFTQFLDLPHGEKTRVKVEVKDKDGYSGNVEKDFTVPENEIFFLGFADGEIGQMNAKGFLEGAGQSRKHDYYSQGRIAYYFKGVVLGKYLVTSALDTGKREFNQMFKDLDRDENDRLLTNLDPDKPYPVYGDSSTTVYDGESQGRFYLAVDSNEFHLLVGNFSVGLMDTELAGYNRMVYGGRAAYQSPDKTRYGAPLTEAVVFGAEIRTVDTQNQFLATGGSLYYLSNNRVIEGSEQVRIEVRDKDTGVLLSSHPQEQNRDYTIKYDEGRIFFNRPVSGVSDDLTGLLDKTPIGGNPVYIVVDYEYEAGIFEENANGGRVRQQIGDHLSIGGTYVRDGEGVEPFELTAGDVEVRVGDGTRILGEYATSRGAGSETTFSADGGLTFAAINPGLDPDGRAFKTSMESDLGEFFGLPNRVLLNGYLKELGSGYSSNGTILEQGTRKAGVGGTFRIGRYDTLYLRYEGVRIIESGNFLSRAQVGGQSSYTETARWIQQKGPLGISAEYQANQLDSPVSDIRSQAAAIRVDYRLTGNLLVFAGQQLSLEGPVRNKTSAGTEYTIGGLRIFGEGSTGTLGEGLRAGLSTEVGGDGLVSISQEFENETENGRSSRSVVHGEKRISRGTRVYSEYQLNRTEKFDSSASIFGVNQRWEATQNLTVNFLGELGKRDQNGEVFTTKTAGMGTRLERPGQIRLSDYFELRHERGMDSKVQYLTRNDVEYWLGRDFRLLAGLNASLTQNRSSKNTEARSSELSMGLAYRPVLNDRFNGLLKYTYLRDQRPVQTLLDIEEETAMAVWSATGSLDLNRYLEWVEKFAFKLKEERIGAGNVIKTHTRLWINRFNYHVIKKWDLGLEYRILSVREARDRQQGFLLEVTREFAEHIRLGAGYNFTDFSDNEFSNNDYSVQGWFFRFQGKY